MVLIRWLVIIEIIGLASWPLCFLLFRRLPDGGLGLAKLLGMLILAYAGWLSASIGLFPYDTASLATFLLLYIFIAALLYQRNRAEINSFFVERKRIILFEQLFFLALFLLAIFIQVYKPDITVAEKEPDMMFLRSILESRGMPPADLWFTGKPVNYYYLGYLVFANPIKLASVRPEIGFNLAVATIVPLACLGAFSLAYNIGRRFSYALLAPLFLMGLGNLDAFVKAVRWGGLAGRDWWFEMFAHGSREVIPGTIHEFPCFSFLLGDLHAHFMFMPFCFLFFSMLFVFFLRHEEIFSNFQPRIWVLFGFFFSLVLGSVVMLNIWDYPNYIFLTFLVALVLTYQYRPERKRWAFFTWLLVLVLLSFFLFLPFYFHFRPATKPEPQLAAASSQLSTISFVETKNRSPILAFLIVNGLGCFVLFSFLIEEFFKQKRGGLISLKGWQFAAVLILAVVIGLVAKSTLVGLLVMTCILTVLVILSRGISSARLFILVMALLSVIIFLGCEFFYLNDFYGARLQRQNTVFKYYFQIWIIFSIVFSVGSLFVVEGLRGAYRGIWKTALTVLIVLSLIYPLWGTYYRCQRFRTGRRAPFPYLPTLDGTAYIKQRYPAEYDALQWVKANIPQEKVILEATGKPYSFYGRVATFTGHPTILGWGNHESLWRDWTWKITMERTQDIKRIYDAHHKRDVKGLIDKYDIRYIYVGTLENDSYSRTGLHAFEKSFPVVYRNKDVRIYEVTKK